VISNHSFTKLKQLRVDNSPNVRFLTELEEPRLRGAIRQRDQELKEDRERDNAFREVRGYELMPSLNSLATLTVWNQ